MTKHYRIYLALAIIYTLLASCSKKQAEEMKPTPSGPGNPETEKVTYTNFTGALFQTRCSGCHAPGRSAAAVFTLNGYASVTANAERIREAVIVTRRMPPGGSLSATELDSLSKWFADGMPEQ
jgi:mono/diheme cytochrome c family protein